MTRFELEAEARRAEEQGLPSFVVLVPRSRLVRRRSDRVRPLGRGGPMGTVIGGQGEHYVVSFKVVEVLAWIARS